MKHKLRKSFSYALFGLMYSFKTQRNFIIEVIASILVIAFFILLKIDLTDLMILIGCCFSVILFELINTAIEFTIDAQFGRKRTVLAKLAKDISASAVLVSVIGSVIIGIILLIKYGRIS